MNESDNTPPETYVTSLHRARSDHWWSTTHNRFVPISILHDAHLANILKRCENAACGFRQEQHDKAGTRDVISIAAAEHWARLQGLNAFDLTVLLIPVYLDLVHESLKRHGAPPPPPPLPILPDRPSPSLPAPGPEGDDRPTTGEECWLAQFDRMLEQISGIPQAAKSEVGRLAYRCWVEALEVQGTPIEEFKFSAKDRANNNMRRLISRFLEVQSIEELARYSAADLLALGFTGECLSALAVGLASVGSSLASEHQLLEELVSFPWHMEEEAKSCLSTSEFVVSVDRALVGVDQTSPAAVLVFSRLRHRLTSRLRRKALATVKQEPKQKSSGFQSWAFQQHQMSRLARETRGLTPTERQTDEPF